ncbi:MAG: tRNA (adenosine(37)-N6)-threonylcarbamoyltransferase complex ATPase subunit type 1 TsaE [Firmicutes bacterium]|nr:tRNA (adenosine(37)-N6)-threonylcarbamoyltransferase complex ATPase subunit type 1 TsaE [Bacillota bacterium]
MILSFVSPSPADTAALGEKIGRRLEQAAVFAAYGDLGAGKTLLAAAIARGLAVEETVTSPTFIYYQRYSGRLPFYHLDGYRLEHLTYEDKIDLGLEECFGGDAVTFVEWPQYAAEFLPAERINIRIDRDETENGRLLTFDFDPDIHPWLCEVLI